MYENELNEKNEKVCKVLGYKVYDEKDENKKLTGNKMFRIIITIDPKIEDYYGETPVAVFLPYNEEFEKDLKKAIDNKNINCTYKTTDNIVTGKTKVTSIIIGY